MGKLDYLDALRRAMAGISADTQAKTLAYYEQRFVDGVAAGRSEEDVAAELDEPKKIAMTLRASVHMHSFEQKKNPANLLRLLVSIAGLAIFNLFMVVPALVYAAFLAILYAAGLAFYVAGIAITASGLSGATELVLDGPFREMILRNASEEERDKLQVIVSIGEEGVHFHQARIDNDDVKHTEAEAEADTAAAILDAGDVVEEAIASSGEAASVAREAGDAVRRVAREAAAARAAGAEVEKRSVVRRAEEAAGRGVRITTELEPGSRTTQTLFGLGIVLAGIIVFLLCLVITKYTMIGFRRYIDMNVSLLKGN
ncbi:DUF1700 domain-containing protein [Massilia sp. CCM 8733]|uniref:DUF1700 domain-containing protein n=1 Tax=Massilia mucilaginosa TaxID=2609282 RepID=A0ABX0NXK9_9BURK|nr:DUF1700 domain-containing protein [Massilia mucilaginosa]NHZ91430.1 DUF1700 domain-containing protein [Massilia mucilaginosa]